MKIVDLCEFYSERGGGVRSYLNRQGKAARARGHELVVVAPGPADAVSDDEGGKVIRYRAPKMPYDPTYHVPWRPDVMRRVLVAVGAPVSRRPCLTFRSLDAHDCLAPSKTRSLGLSLAHAA